jgi:hypothetical protein
MIKHQLADIRAKVDHIYKTTDLQAKIDSLRDRVDFYDDPEAKMLREASTFAEKLMVTHAFHGLKGVATVLNFARLDRDRYKQAAVELRKAGDDLSRTIADMTEMAAQMNPKRQPWRWQPKLKKK